MSWVLAVKIVAVLYAGVGAWRARFLAGFGALFTALYLTLARLASLVPPYPPMPLRGALEASWWLYPTLMVLLSAGPMFFAFRAARRYRDDDPMHRRYELAAYAFLANALFDAAILVIAVVGTILVARDA